MKIKNQKNLSLVIFKSFIRSNFDYIFIPLLTDTQRIKSDIQKLQNRILKTIHHFPLKTKIIKMHKKLKIDLIDSRITKLFEKFVASKTEHRLIQDELKSYNRTTNQRFKTPFDVYKEIWL